MPLLPVAFSADIAPAGSNSADATSTAATGFRPLVKDDRAATPVLAPPSSEGEQRIKQFQLAPGLSVKLWAAEPQLANPVAFSVDEQGHVFTSETYRYRTSVLDIRHYMFMLEDDLASRTVEDRLAQIRKWFGPEGEAALARETEVIRKLEDTDHDGRADRSTVVADHFTSPLGGIGSGVLARQGQVWFTEIPSLWHIGPAGSVRGNLPKPKEPALQSQPKVHPESLEARAILHGFGVRFSFTGHDLHGLIFGPDGRLYFSCGDRGAHVVTQEGTVIDLPDEGAVFRCEPDGSKLEVVHRGLRNPQELAFNDEGDLFTGDNDSDQGDRERWVQVIEGADSGWRVGHQHAPLGNAGLWNLERLWVPPFEGQSASILTPIANIGDGPSGLVHDSGTSLPKALRGRFLLAYFKGTSAKSGISSLQQRPAGATYELVAHDPLVWNSLVPDVDLGPDGSIFFADWHEGWPKSNKGRIYKATFAEVTADPEVARTQRLLAAGMKDKKPDELSSLLGHRDQRVRQEAQYEWARRGSSSVPTLKTLASTATDQWVRIHAIRALGQLARNDPARLGKALLSVGKSSEGEVRVQAIRALASTTELVRLASVAPWLKDQLAHTNPRVRLAAALGLGRARLSDGDAAAFIGSVRRFGKPDAVLRHGLAYGLASALSDRVIEAHRSEADREVRQLVLLAARIRRSSAIRGFLSDPDPWLALEAARAIHDLPLTSALPDLAALAEPAALQAWRRALAGQAPRPVAMPAAGAIRDLRTDQPLPWGDAPVDHTTPMLLRIVNANFRLGTPQAAQRLAARARDTGLPERIRTEALLALGHWETPPARDRLLGIHRPLPARPAAPAIEALGPGVAGLLEDASEAVQVAAVESVARLQLTNSIPALEALVRRTSAPAKARAAALTAAFRLAQPPTALQSLLTFAAADPAEPLRLAASKLSTELNPNGAVGKLSSLLERGALAEQQAAFASLGDLKSDAADAVLAEWLDRLMKREVANEVMLDLVEAARKHPAAAVQTRLAAYQDWKLPKDALSPYREALMGGNVSRGRTLFYEHAAVACTRCHQIGTDSGGNAGPKLDGLASRATREHLLESIVLPNAQIATGFESTLVTTLSGAVLAAVVRNETDTSLTLLTPDEGEVSLSKKDIRTRSRGPSGMPEGFGDALTRFELRDLVEFLGTLK
jgi:quinoprotein glucose dehydrogenase